MAHEVETMMYVGEIPWHKQGTPLQDIATAEEAIIASGLDWDVELRKIYQETKSGTISEVPGKYALARVTDDLVYGVYGKQYSPMQNRKGFTFFNDVVGNDDAKYVAAGSLRKGAIIWILAELKGSRGVKGEEVKQYLILANSHNGEFALQMWWTPIRVVCMNTLKMAMSRDTQRFYSRHTKGMDSRVDQAQMILGVGNAYFEEFERQANILANRQMNSEKLEAMLKHVFNWEEVVIPVGKEKVLVPTRKEERMGDVMSLFEHGKGMDNPDIRGTMWAGYNAVAEFTDHQKEYRTDPVYGLWFGSGAALKDRAWNWCLTN